MDAFLAKIKALNPIVLHGKVGTGDIAYIPHKSIHNRSLGIFQIDLHCRLKLIENQKKSENVGL